MNNTHSAEQAALQRELIKVVAIDTFGTLIFVLAVYTKFGAVGEPTLHPWLQDEAVVMALLVAGGAIMVWGMIRILSIFKRRKALLES